MAALSSAGGLLYAQSGVAVKIWGEAFREDEVSCWFQLSGNFMPSTPTANDGYKSDYSDGRWPTSPSTANLGSVWVEPGKSYTITNGHGDALDVLIELQVPQGYRAIVDGQTRTKIYTLNDVVFTVVPEREYPGLAGMASDISMNKLDWEIPLGTLQNGESAGSLRLIDPAIYGDWTGIFSDLPLYYEAPSDEIVVLRSGNLVQGIIAHQVRIIVNISAATGRSAATTRWNGGGPMARSTRL